MAINLLTGNAEKLEKKMTIGAKVFGKGKGTYRFDGVNSVVSLTPITQSPNTYNPAAEGSRFGTLAEVEDTKHTYTLSAGPCNNMSIDKTYNTAQKMLKRAAEIMTAQIEEQYIPYMDKAALTAKVTDAGQTSVDGELAAATIFGAFTKARTGFVNEKVAGSGKDLVAWVPSTIYSLILQDDRFESLEKLGGKVTTDGAIGRYAGFDIIEVPDDYLDDGINFVAANTKCIIDVDKFRTLRILEEHPDVDGAVLQPHFVFGSFVNQANKKGVYVSYEESPSV